MVKAAFGNSFRMALQTGRAAIQIPAHPLMFAVHFRLKVAGAGTGIYLVIGWVGVALRAFVPFAVVLSRIDGEILPIVVKGCWLPSGL